MTNRILLTDGNERAALAATRSLLRAGYDVLVAAPGRSLAGAVRGAVPVHVAASPLDAPAAFAAAVAGLAHRHGARLVLPLTDASVRVMVEHRAQLPVGTMLPFPPEPVVRLTADKARVLDLARSAGLATPATHVLEAGGAIADDLPWPLVVKPHRSVVATRRGWRRTSVTTVANRVALDSVLRAMPRAAFPVLLQEHLAGPGVGLFLLRWEGRTIAAFAHRRLREKPPSGGVSVYRESIAAAPVWREAGERLLTALGWVGAAMIECKIDPRTGAPALMEINGRFWGSLQLAIDAGVDFPRLLAACALGVAPEPVTRWRVGVRSRWLWGDIDHLYLRLRHGPNRLGAVAAFLAHRPGRDRLEVERWSDPGPALLETVRRLRPSRHPAVASDTAVLGTAGPSM